MQIAPFGVEQWMNEYETRCRHNLAETCCDSITVEELLQLSGQSPEHLHELLDMKLTYGAIEGSDRLRSAIAALYESGHETYNEAVDRIASGGEDGIRIHEIAPDEPLKSDGYQVKVDSLWADYHLGLAKGLDLMATQLTLGVH